MIYAIREKAITVKPPFPVHLGEGKFIVRYIEGARQIECNLHYALT